MKKNKLLIGGRGVGKTSMATEISKAYLDKDVVRLNSPRISSETSLPKLPRNIKLIIVDEIASMSVIRYWSKVAKDGMRFRDKISRYTIHPEIILISQLTIEKIKKSMPNLSDVLEIIEVKKNEAA